MNLRQRWKQTAVHNKALVLTSVLVAFGTIFYAAAAGFQVWLMVESGKHTDEQIGRIIGNANWMARAMDETAKTTQDQMRLEQRAWIGLTFPNLDEAKEISDKAPLQVIFQCPFELTNYGKTPAKNVEIDGNCTLLQRGKGELDLGEFGPKHHSRIRFESVQPSEVQKNFGLAAILAQNGQAVRPVFTTPQIWEEVRTAQTYVVGHGYITFTDTFGHTHWIRFCHAYNADLGGTEACYRYNQSDDDLK